MTAESPTEAQRQQRYRFVQALNRMDASWMEFLEDKEVFDINYSDLFTGLWAAGVPVRKQEAVQFMRHLGPQTGKKYLDRAIDRGQLKEVADPRDGRAKLIELSPDLRVRLERFFDHAIALFREALGNDDA